MIWLVGAALAATGECEPIGMKDVMDVPAPAVIVLGERHGTQPDLARAARVVRKLAKRGPVTLALESVHEKYQSVLDDYSVGHVTLEHLPGQLDWSNSWGFGWRPYQPLVTAADLEVKVVAAGNDLGPPPADAPQFPIPSGYMQILADAMADHLVPVELHDRFVRSMAWYDFRIADDALSHWDGNGWLVIVAGRGHIEGGKGVTWQVAQQKPDVKVAGFVLGWADPICYRGDRVWRKGLFG
jgi:uncharacterized iron-regulated protein